MRVFNSLRSPLLFLRTVNFSLYSPCTSFSWTLTALQSDLCKVNFPCKIIVARSKPSKTLNSQLLKWNWDPSSRILSAVSYGSVSVRISAAWKGSPMPSYVCSYLLSLCYLYKLLYTMLLKTSSCVNNSGRKGLKPCTYLISVGLVPKVSYPTPNWLIKMFCPKTSHAHDLVSLRY